MNMEENAKKIDNLEKAKTIMGKIDPALLSAALSEMMMEADEAEEADVAKVKKAIKGIYDSIPEGKDKTSIVSKAIKELDSEIIEKEVKVIKGRLASIDRVTIMEAAKDFVDIQEIKACICKSAVACVCALKYYINSPVICKSAVACVCALKYYINSPVKCACSISGGSDIAYCYKGCIGYFIKPPGCSCGIQYLVEPYHEWEMDPRIKGQLTEEIIQEVLQRPELPRAMKKMLKEIQDEK
jgi:hypothetical protein